MHKILKYIKRLFLEGSNFKAYFINLFFNMFKNKHFHKNSYNYRSIIEK